MAAPIAYIGNYGMRVERSALIAKCGIKSFGKILNSLTVKEVAHRGRKNMRFALKTRRAYSIEKMPVPQSTNGIVNAQPSEKIEFVVFPRIVAATLKKHGLVSKIVADTTPEYKLFPARVLSDESASFEPPDELFTYQRAAVDHVCGLFRERRKTFGASVYLQMDTGIGKTRTAVAIVCAMKVAAVIVVPTVGIAEQWIDEFKESCPHLKCALYRNPKKNAKKVMSAETHDVLVCVINTFHKKDAAFMKGFGLTVFDEAHELHSREFGGSLWVAQSEYVLGLSATPFDRPDQLDHYVPKHLGAVVWQESIPGFDLSDAKFRGEAWRIEYTGHPDHCETAVMDSGTVSANGTICNLMGDPHRNQLIVDTTVRLYNMHLSEDAEKYGLGKSEGDPEGAPIRRHGVLLVSEHRDVLINMRKLLLTRFKAEEIDAPELDAEGKNLLEKDSSKRSISVLRGGVAKNELKSARGAGAHVVLSTYGYIRRGISLVDMTCLIEISPRRNGQRQLLGRIERRGSDQRIVRIKVDIVDVRTGLKSQASERLKVYKEKNYAVVKSQVSYDEIEVPEGKEMTKKEDEFERFTVAKLLTDP